MDFVKIFFHIIMWELSLSRKKNATTIKKRQGCSKKQMNNPQCPDEIRQEQSDYGSEKSVYSYRQKTGKRI